MTSTDIALMCLVSVKHSFTAFASIAASLKILNTGKYCEAAPPGNLTSFNGERNERKFQLPL